jgi:hypothetical protein
MIDGWPGTPWIVGSAFRAEAIRGWGGKDFTSAGRWIEVRFARETEIGMLRAIVSPQAQVELQLPHGQGWRTVPGQRVVDQPPRHHCLASATTTARFAPVRVDRFRVVFVAPRSDGEAVFELAAAL